MDATAPNIRRQAKKKEKFDVYLITKKSGAA